MKPISPRRYQRRAYQQAWKLAAAGESVLVQSPGGSGKTIIIGLLVKRALKEKKKVLVLAHRRELVRQARRVLLRMGVPEGTIRVIMQGEKVGNANGSVILASWATLRNREKPDVDWLLLDEAHHAPAQSSLSLLQEYSQASVVGLTATPHRLDKVGLDTVFTHLLRAVRIKTLIRKGLTPVPYTFAPFGDGLRAILANIKVRAGDYAKEELDDIMRNRKLVGDIVGDWKKKADGKITVVFCCSVEHAVLVRDQFRAAGISAEHVEANTSTEERKRILEDVAAGRTLVITNCDILSEGWDLPQCRAVILARPTLSRTMYIQQCARVLRPGTAPYILDHACNTYRHGLCYLDTPSSLKGEDLQKSHSMKPVKQCPDCGAVQLASNKRCEVCDGFFPPSASRKIPEYVNGEVTSVDVAEAEIRRRLVRYAKSKSIPLPHKWAAAVLRRRGHA